MKTTALLPRPGGTRRIAVATVVASLLSVCAAILANVPQASAATYRIMPLGDSITEGNAVPGGYRIQLEDQLVGGGFSFDFVGSLANGPASLADKQHEGHPGFTITDVVNSVGGYLNTSQPDVVLLLIGTNDMAPEDDPANASGRLAGLVDAITAARPSARLMVGSIPPSPDPTTNQRINSYNADIVTIVQGAAGAGKLVSYVNVGGSLTTADLSDGVHPTLGGYNKMASAWYSALQGVLTGGGGGGGGTASLSASPSSVSPGGQVTGSWSGISGPTSTDWIGLYRAGTADTAFVTFVYTTGAASGNRALTVPGGATSGTYELRLFKNNTYTRLATSNAITVGSGGGGGGGASISASPTSVSPGGQVTGSWSGIPSPTGSDWIGLYRAGTADTAFVTYVYTTGAASGNRALTVPTGATSGTYELRLFTSGSYNRLATSNAITVGSGGGGGGGGAASLNASPTSVSPGGQVTGSWSAIAAPSGTDWIGLYRTGTVDGAYLTYVYTTGGASGNRALTVPGGATSGTYELRLFTNNTYTRLATSNTFTVGSGGGGSVAVSSSPTTVTRGNQITVGWSGVPNPTPNDWVGLYTPGAADGSYFTWRYTTGTASGSAPLTIPTGVSPGTYELRLFANNSYTRLATSGPINVTA